MKTIVESRGNRSGTLNALFAGIALALLLATPARADYGYSYFRTVEGGASLQSAEGGESLEALENHPLIAGDFLQVDRGGRIEIVLADGGLLRIAGGTEISFDSLAWTQDTDATVTRLYLARGEVQAVLRDDVATYEPLEIETRDGSLSLRAPGTYRVEVLDRGGIELVVREGFAEARVDSGLTIVRSGEAAYLDRWGGTELASAPDFDYLERWGEDLDAEARLAEVPYVEPELRYRAARMSSHGNWIDVGGRWGWRPYVSVGWRPYTSGSWVYTPSGITWVSREPWGWIPSHYGSWDLVVGVGWVWFAGGHYSPANVYWYWGPTHVAWVPAGYYTSYYSGRYGYGPRFGVYGWAGGSWGFFSEWVFCPTRYFGRSRYDRYFRSGHEVARHVTYREVPRGIIATDTRTLRRDVWGKPDRIAARLEASDTRLARGSALPDVTDFVARRRDLKPDVAEITKPADLTAAARRGRPSITAPVTGSVAERPSGSFTRPRGDARVDARTVVPKTGVPKVGDSKTDSSGRPAASRPAERDTDLDRGRVTYSRPAPGLSRPAPRPAPRPEDRGLDRYGSDRYRSDRGEPERKDAGSVFTRPDPRSDSRPDSRPDPRFDRPTPRPAPRIEDEKRVYERPRGLPFDRSERSYERPSSAPSAMAPSAVRPPTGSSTVRPPIESASGERPVVQKVIEQLRGSRGASPPSTYSRPATPPARSAPSTSSTSTRARPPQPARSSARGSTSSSRRSEARKPPARQSGSRRSGSRKPPSPR